MRNHKGELFVRKSVSLSNNREYGFQRWYSQLKKIQRYSALYPGLFPELLDYGKDKNSAYMDIEFFDKANNAQNFIMTCTSKRDINIFFRSLIFAMSTLHKVEFKSSKNIMSLYLNEEIDQRFNDCESDKVFSEFTKYDEILFNGVKVKSFKKVLSSYKKMCMEYFSSDMETFTHGNITLENLLYVEEDQRIIMIDPYEENVIDSPLAEFSQILQSSNSKYELYNCGKAIVKENEIKLELEPSYGIDYFNKIFLLFLKDNLSTEDYITVRLLEISQFIRMLPFKLEVDKNKMILFYGLASYLFSKLENEVKEIEKTK